MEVAPRIAHNLIVSTAAPVVVYFCQESVLFSIEIAKFGIFWPFLAILAILLQIYALFGAHLQS